MKSNILLLVRGLPGSGKSTFAKKLTNFIHWEADMYFIDENGNYNYQLKFIQNAHKWCLKRTMDSLMLEDNVVVTNTFTTKWEMDPYIQFAKKENIGINIITLRNQFKNIHNVPEEVYEKMKQRFEEYPIY